MPAKPPDGRPGRVPPIGPPGERSQPPAGAKPSELELLFAQLLEFQPQTRQDACRKLGQLGERQAVLRLFEVLAIDRDAGVRVAAIAALGQLRSAEAIGPIMVHLRDQSPLVRSEAARVLGDLGAKQAAEQLVGCTRDEDEMVWKAAGIALGKLQVPDSVQMLIQQMCPLPSRLGPVFALVQIGSATIKPLYDHLLHLDGRDLYRWEYVHSWSFDYDHYRYVGPILVLTGLGRGICGRIINEGMKHQGEMARLVSAEALRRLGDRQAVPVLCQAARSDASETVRLVSIMALPAFQDSSVVPALTHALSEPNAILRRQAARSLGLLKDARSVVPLCDTLRGDRDASVRQYAAKALGQIGDREATLTLLGALGRDRSDKVRAEAARALGEVKDERSVRSLRSVAGDKQENLEVMAAAQQALAAMRR